MPTLLLVLSSFLYSIDVIQESAYASGKGTENAGG